MKFNINKLIAVLAVASLGVACNKEQLQDEIPSSGNGTVTRSSMPEEWN